MVILEIEITIFTCPISSEWYDGYPKHLDLALTPTKINEQVEKQWNIH